MTIQPAFGMPGTFEWLLIFLAVLLLFGAKRLPEIARSLGKASKEFKKARREFSEVADDMVQETPADAPKKLTTDAPAEDAGDEKKNA